MVLRLVLYLIAGLASLLLLGRGVGRLIRPLLEERRLRRLAAMRAVHRCNECGELLLPEHPETVFDYGRYHHWKCLTRLLNPT